MRQNCDESQGPVNVFLERNCTVCSLLIILLVLITRILKQNEQIYFEFNEDRTGYVVEKEGYCGEHRVHFELVIDECIGKESNSTQNPAQNYQPNHEHLLVCLASLN